MPKNIIQPDPTSLTTHHLVIAFNNEVLGSGTGFIYRSGSNFYMITNWHVVSGKHPDTGRCLSQTGGVPNGISTLFREKDNPRTCHRELLTLYMDKYMEKPAWMEHPIHKDKVDVVAIPLPDELKKKYDLFAINDIAFDRDYKEVVADETFVVGYPFQDVPYLHLPIWKKASIASEPDVNIDQLPKFYVDTATRAGLSGSPVLMRRIGIHGLVDGKMIDKSLIGEIRNFVGVYSGRVGDDEFKAQLGIVWKAKVLQEIIGQ